jgi:hypothetical protein
MKKSSPLGWTEDKPMILVEPERRRELFNRPFKVLSGHRAAGWVCSEFPHLVLFLTDEQPHGHDPTGPCADKWKCGDLGFTDGFITQMYPFIALDMVHCNIHGMWGCKWCFHILDVYLHNLSDLPKGNPPLLVVSHPDSRHSGHQMISNCSTSKLQSRGSTAKGNCDEHDLPSGRVLCILMSCS